MSSIPSHPLFGPDAEASLQQAREHDIITHSKLDALLPGRVLTSNEIESVFEFLAAQGISVVDD